MNLFQLVFKQMRQRSLSTWLTLLSVLLGVALGVSVLIIYRQGANLFVQKTYGYDVLIGPPKAAPLQLVLNTVYQVDVSQGTVPYQVYEDLLRNRAMVKIAIPYAVGDSYRGHRIIGTAPKLFGFNDAGEPLAPEQVLEYQPGRRYELAEGKVFHPEKFEAVIGSDITARTGLKLGDTFKATHGIPGPNDEPDEHEQLWTVTGVLKPTHTAMDRVLFIPLTSFYAMREHAEGLEQLGTLKRGQGASPAPVRPLPVPPTPAPPPAKPDAHKEHDHKHDEHDQKDEEHGQSDEKTAQKAEAADDHDHDHAHEQFELRPDGTIELKLPKQDWELSAILVKARGQFQAGQMLYNFKMVDLRASAVNPAAEMRNFIRTFLAPTSLVLLLISLLVVVVASIGILVAIYNSVAARMREIAILRALGATRRKILALICLEAGLIGLAGAVLGAIVGHAIAAAASMSLNRLLGQGFRWLAMDWWLIAGLAGVVVLAVLAGLVPALKAYRTPVATNLVAG